MSNGAPPANNGFENLTHSGLFKITSKDDKAVTFQIDSYGGLTSFVVFTGAGGRPWKQNLSIKAVCNILILLRKMREDPRPCREPIMLSEWDPETKKVKQIGQIGIGIDDNLMFQIDVAANGLNGRHIFPIRSDLKFDFSNTSMTEKEAVQGLIDSLIRVLETITPIAERLSGFKRAPGGPGGARGNFGGANKSYGDAGGQGGYQNRNAPQQNSSTFSDGNIENDLHV